MAALLIGCGGGGPPVLVGAVTEAGAAIEVSLADATPVVTADGAAGDAAFRGASTTCLATNLFDGGCALSGDSGLESGRCVAFPTDARASAADEAGATCLTGRPPDYSANEPAICNWLYAAVPGTQPATADQIVLSLCRLQCGDTHAGYPLDSGLTCGQEFAYDTCANDCAAAYAPPAPFRGAPSCLGCCLLSTVPISLAHLLDPNAACGQ